MADNKFLFISEGGAEGTLIAEDGGVAITWHNGEYVLGQCYRERLQGKHLKKGFANAFEKMMEDSSNSAMFDFEGHDYLLPMHLEELADWLVSGREGTLIENMIYLDSEKLTDKQISKEVKKFLNNEYFYDKEVEEGELKLDFAEEVKRLDKKWSEAGMTCDATDLMAHLDVKYGYFATDEIKKAVEEFYQITL